VVTITCKLFFSRPHVFCIACTKHFIRHKYTLCHARAGTDLELDTTYTALGNPHVRAMRRAVLDSASIANASSPALAAVCAEYRLTSARASGGEGESKGEDEGESGPCAAGSSTLAGEWLTADTRLHPRKL
jgi:hypothetical protein